MEIKKYQKIKNYNSSIYQYIACIPYHLIHYVYSSKKRKEKKRKLYSINSA